MGTLLRETETTSPAFELFFAIVVRSQQETMGQRLETLAKKLSQSWAILGAAT